MKLTRLLITASCAALVGGSAAAQEITTVNVLTPLPRHTSWYPLIVGEALGYFEEEGIAVELVLGGDLPATAFLDTGQVHIASLDSSEVINAQQRGFDFDVVYEVMHGAIEGIFVLESNPVTSLSELSGTTIGIVGESDRGLLLAALGHAGLSPDDVTIAVLGESAPLLANSLDTGQVSAIVGASSDLVAIRSQGVEVKNFLPEEMRAQPANSFSMRADVIEERPEFWEGFFRAWAKSAHVAEIDEDVVAAMTREAAPENWLQEEFGRLYLSEAMRLHTPANGIYGELRTPVWEAVQEEFVVVGELDAPFDTETFLNTRFIEAANDFDREEVAAEVEAWKAENM